MNTHDPLECTLARYVKIQHLQTEFTPDLITCPAQGDLPGKITDDQRAIPDCKTRNQRLPEAGLITDGKARRYQCHTRCDQCKICRTDMKILFILYPDHHFGNIILWYRISGDPDRIIHEPRDHTVFVFAFT